MTPTRAKRNSKAPNRFSSDYSRIETANSNGETIIDYNDNSTSTTHNLAPISRTIKLKPTIREPLKVKLPKLKRHHITPAKQTSLPESNHQEVKIHKIKLPSFANKSKSTATKKDLTKKEKESPSLINKTSVKVAQLVNKSLPKIEAKINPTNDLQTADESPAKLDTSTTSKSTSAGEESFSALKMCLTSPIGMDSGSSRIGLVTSPADTANSSGIRCPCGVGDDLGVMVECERCSTWQHGHCINVGSEDDAYEGYVCAYCSMAPGTARESLRLLTVGDKFQSRFERLEAMKAEEDTEGIPPNLNGVVEYKSELNLEDLHQTILDLKRALNSLKVKWRLLTSQAYETELRIWQNPFWSGDSSSNPGQDETMYFMDRCKANLKQNIRNMVDRMDERCRLINYAISKIQSSSHSRPITSDIPFELKIEEVNQLFGELVPGVKDFKNKLKHLCDQIV